MTGEVHQYARREQIIRPGGRGARLKDLAVLVGELAIIVDHDRIQADAFIHHGQGHPQAAHGLQPCLSCVKTRRQTGERALRILDEVGQRGPIHE